MLTGLYANKENDRGSQSPIKRNTIASVEAITQGVNVVRARLCTP